MEDTHKAILDNLATSLVHFNKLQAQFREQLKKMPQEEANEMLDIMTKIDKGLVNSDIKQLQKVASVLNDKIKSKRK